MEENGCDDSMMRDRSPIRDDGSDLDDSRRRDRRGPRRVENRGRKATAERRVYISNVPYEMKWQDIKDLFAKEVGEVTYVNLFNDEKGKSRGCGVVEFADEDTARVAVDKMHKYNISGRDIVVKEDTDKERDRYGFFVKETGGRNIKNEKMRRMSGGDRDDASKFGNTYGLNISFLESLGINGPLVSRIFVANLDYKVDEKKLREIFRLAGKIISCELHKDKDGQSRGYGTIEYEHPVEAVQAISMFKDQILFDRKMAVRMDSAAMREEKEGIPSKLPNGLKGIGMGLGSAGAPLKNVLSNMASGGGVSGGGSGNINRNTVANLAAAGGLGGGLGNLGLAGGLGALGAAGLGAQLGAGVGLGGLGSLGGGAGLGLGLQGSGLMGGGGLGGGYGDARRGSSGNSSRDDARRRTWD